MPINIDEGNTKTVIHTVQNQTNTISDNLKKIVKTLENSAERATFFKPNERVSRAKACQQVLAPLTAVSAKLAHSLGMTQGQTPSF